MAENEVAPSVSVVVPCYNEGENIPLLAEAIDKVFRENPGHSYECLLVDDGSTDDTREQIVKIRQTIPAVRGIHLVKNTGQSAALYLGMKMARGKYILTLDADLQNDPANFPEVLALLEEHDCVCGYRAERNDTWIRRVSSKIANRVRNWVLHDGIRDTGCGMKGFRRVCVEHLVPFNGMHRFFAVMVRNAGLSIAEVPVKHHARVHGVSKYGVNNRLWRGLYDLVGVSWLRKRFVHPVAEDPE